MKIKNLLFTLVVLIIGCSIVKGQPGKIQFVEYDLKNGLHVILHQDNSTPIVAVTVMYHVGSKNERPDRTGFAHLFEHLMFEGTRNIPRFEYTKYVEKAGGTLNANTSNDRTYYFEILPSNQLEMGLWLESERMFQLKVDSIGIKTQKNVVIEEKKQSYDNRPYGSLQTELMKRAFKKHPYNWTVIGNVDHLRAAKDQDIVDFYKTFYVPNNAVLTIAGDINLIEAKKLIEKYYADIPKGLNPVNRPDPNMEPAMTKEIRDTIYDNVQLPMIIQAYRVPALGSADYYALDMMAEVLGGRGQSSRLNKAVVDGLQKASRVSVNMYDMEHPGLLMINAMPNIGIQPGDVESAIDLEIEKIKKDLITDKEIQKIKNQFENRLISQNASIAGIAGRLATSYTYFKKTDLVNTDLDNYMKITKEDILKAANTYLRKDNRVVLYYMPKTVKK